MRHGYTEIIRRAPSTPLSARLKDSGTDAHLTTSGKRLWNRARTWAIKYLVYMRIAARPIVGVLHFGHNVVGGKSTGTLTLNPIL